MTDDGCPTCVALNVIENMAALLDGPVVTLMRRHKAVAKEAREYLAEARGAIIPNEEVHDDHTA